MIPSWFLSMWISNSATAAMMVTIALAVISQLEESEKQLYKNSRRKDTGSLKLNDGDLSLVETPRQGVANESYEADASTEFQTEDELRKGNEGGLSVDSDTEDDEELEGFKGKWVEMGKGILMCTAYSASIGGIATITGTFSNLIFQENLAR